MWDATGRYIELLCLLLCYSECCVGPELTCKIIDKFVEQGDRKLVKWSDSDRRICSIVELCLEVHRIKTMVRCPYLWKPVTVLLFSNLVRTCSLNYVFSAPSLGVTLVDTVSVTPIYEHPIPFLILELPYAQLLEVHICVWKLLLPHSKSFLNKYTQ